MDLWLGCSHRRTLVRGTPQHCSMFANTHQILYTSTGRPAYPPGCAGLRATMGNLEYRHHTAPTCALRHMHRRLSPPFPTPPLRTNIASRRPGFVRRFRPVIRFVRGGDSVRADRPDHPIHTSKEVTMFKRVTIVALVVAAFVLLMAVPALAFNGYRGDYTTQRLLRDLPQRQVSRHPRPRSIDRLGGRPSTARTRRRLAALKSLPYGSVCAGCHTANYAPAKVTPIADGDARRCVADHWAAATGHPAVASRRPATPPRPRLDIGCSSCHYGATTGDAPAVRQRLERHRPQGPLRQHGQR